MLKLKLIFIEFYLDKKICKIDKIKIFNVEAMFEQYIFTLSNLENYHNLSSK